VEVGEEAPADVAARADHLPPPDALARDGAGPAPAEVGVDGLGAVGAGDPDDVVRGVGALALVVVGRGRGAAAAGGADRRADRHGEVVGELARVAVADDAPVALGAEALGPGRPGEAVGRVGAGRVAGLVAGPGQAVVEAEPGEEEGPGEREAAEAEAASPAHGGSLTGSAMLGGSGQAPGEDPVIKKVAFVSFRSKDMGADARFWGELLGLEKSVDHGKWVEFQTPEGKTVAIEQYSPAGTPPTLALETDDIEAEVARLEEAGVPFHGEIMDNQVCKMAFAQDPSGNTVMLHQIAPERLRGEAPTRGG